MKTGIIKIYFKIVHKIEIKFVYRALVSMNSRIKFYAYKLGLLNKKNDGPKVI